MLSRRGWAALLLSLPVVVLASTMLCAADPPTSVEAAQHYTYEAYLVDFGKAYATPEEYDIRRAQFERTKQLILQHNTQASYTYRLGFNAFADMYTEEIARFAPGASDRHGSVSFGRQSSPAVPGSSLPQSGGDRARALDSSRMADIPEQFTWQDRQPPVLTPVKSQAMCGACWAHAAAEAIESAVAIRHGRLVNVSVEQLTACTPNVRQCGGTGGCGGGTVQLALDYAAAVNGLLSSEEYPYTSGAAGVTGPCLHTVPSIEKRSPQSAAPSPVRVTWHTRVEPNSAEATVHALVHNGPLAVNVDASAWIFYSSGIFSACGRQNSNITINHAVQLVGYGVDSTTNTSFWIVRNSWGAAWGERGYMRLLRSARGDAEMCRFVNDWYTQGGGCPDEPVQTIIACGMCGVLYDVSYVTVAQESSANSAHKWAVYTACAGLLFAMAVTVTYTLLRFTRAR